MSSLPCRGALWRFYGKRCCLWFTGMALVAAGLALAIMHLWHHDTASLLLSFHYEEASEGAYPNGERLMMSDFVAPSMLSRLIEAAGLSDVLDADTLSQAIAVEPVMPKNVQEPYLTSTYRITVDLPSSLTGVVTASNIAEHWAQAFTEAFAQRVMPEWTDLWSMEVPEVFAEPEAQEKWLQARLTQLEQLASQFAAAWPDDDSEAGLTFHELFLLLASLPAESVTCETISGAASTLMQMVRERQSRQAGSMVSCAVEAAPTFTTEQYLLAAMIAFCAGIAAVCMALLFPVRSKGRAKR